MKTILKVLLILMLLVTVGLVGAVAATGGDTALIGMTLMWGYFLIAFALVSALLCAVFGMIQAPAGLKTAIISLILVAVVVGLSYQMAISDPKEILNLEDGSFFDPDSTVISEVCILVAYAAGAAAVLVSLLSELAGVYRSIVK